MGWECENGNGGGHDQAATISHSPRTEHTGQAAARRGPELSHARAAVHPSAQPVQPRTKCLRD